MRVIPVILCGGEGTRLWPESKASFPKQFLRLVDNHSLLKNTLERAIQVSHCPASDIVCVSLESYADDVRSVLEDFGAGQHILSEPVGRNTAAAVALAACYCQRTFGTDSYIWIVPSDHYVGKPEVLEAALGVAVQSAQDGNLVTFGITPTRPETGYGYIQCLKDSAFPVLPVERFVEKPDSEMALSFLQDGSYYWNSGMFLFRTERIIEVFEELASDIFYNVRQSIEKGISQHPDFSFYSQIPVIPFDKAIMEKAEAVTVVPCEMAWSDVGTWESIWTISEKSEQNNVISGQVVAVESSDCLVRSNGDRLVALAGVDNIVVIDTDDALLVARKNDMGAFRILVEQMKGKNHEDFLP